MTYLYAALPGVLLIISIALNNLKNPRQLRILSLFAVTAICILVAARPIELGVDTKAYLDILRSPSNFWLVNEPGFMILNVVLSSLTIPDPVYLFTLSVLINIPLIIAGRELFGRYALLIFAALLCTHYYWLINIQLLRNGVSTAFFLLGFAFGLNNKNKKEFICYTVACSFHFISILPVLVVMLLQAFTLQKFIKYILASLIVFVFVFLYADSYFNQWVEKYHWYTQLASDGVIKSEDTTKLYHLIPLLLFPLYLYFRRRLCANTDALGKAYFSIGLVALGIFGGNALFLDRVYLFALVLEPFFIFGLLKTIFNRHSAFITFFSFYILIYLNTMILWWPRNFIV